MADIAPKLIHLSAEELNALHNNVHKSEADPATIEVHHTILNEMARRKMERPQDDWDKYEILVDSIENVDLTSLNGLPAETLLDVIKETGDTAGNIKTFFTVNGYQMRFEPVEKRITKEGDKYTVYNEAGTRSFGSYDSKEEAEERLRQIEFFKEEETYKPPKGVREAAQRALEWIEAGLAGGGFTSVGRTRAGQLARGESVSIDTLKRMKSFLARHKVDEQALGFNRGEKGFPSAGRVSWDAWGGDAGFAWAESMVERFENKVKKHGDHDQSSHGSWATGGGGGEEDRASRMRSGNIPDIKRDADGKVSNPDSTGGYKANVAEKVVMGKDGKFKDLGDTKPEPGQLVLTPTDSMWHHLKSDGAGGFEFTEDRAYLHYEIVKELTAGVESLDEPTFFMLGGGPASGKSSAIREGSVQVPSATSKDAVYINPDDIKEKLPENGRMRQGGDSEFFHAATFSHEESSYLAKLVQAEAIRNSQSIVLDGTGDSAIQKLGGKVEAARQAGYKVEGHYVTIPTDTAVQRSNTRALGESKRFVPEKVVRDTHRDVSNTFNLAIKADLFDSIKLYDNSGPKPRLIFDKVKGSPATIADTKAYDEFLAKGNE